MYDVVSIEHLRWYMRTAPGQHAQEWFRDVEGPLVDRGIEANEGEEMATVRSRLYCIVFAARTEP